jgi:hypothetical protein
MYSENGGIIDVKRTTNEEGEITFGVGAWAKIPSGTRFTVPDHLMEYVEAPLQCPGPISLWKSYLGCLQKPGRKQGMILVRDVLLWLHYAWAFVAV